MARKAKVAQMTKVCARTGFTITGTPDEVAEGFYRDKSQKDGFSPWSKDAERTYNKAYYAALKAEEATRVRDMNDNARASFDASMHKAGVRTSRAKVVKVDNKRTKGAKATTKARKVARATKNATTGRTSVVRKATKVKAA